MVRLTKPAGLAELDAEPPSLAELDAEPESSVVH